MANIAQQEADEAKQVAEELKSYFENKQFELISATDEKLVAAQEEAEDKFKSAEEKHRVETADALESQKKEHELFLEDQAAEAASKEASILEEQTQYKAATLLKTAVASRANQQTRNKLNKMAKIAQQEADEAKNVAEELKLEFEKKHDELGEHHKIEMTKALEKQKEEHDFFLKMQAAKAFSDGIKSKQEKAKLNAENLLRKAISSRNTNRDKKKLQDEAAEAQNQANELMEQLNKAKNDYEMLSLSHAESKERLLTVAEAKIHDEISARTDAETEMGQLEKAKQKAFVLLAKSKKDAEIKIKSAEEKHRAETADALESQKKEHELFLEEQAAEAASKEASNLEEQTQYKAATLLKNTVSKANFQTRDKLNNMAKTAQQEADEAIQVAEELKQYKAATFLNADVASNANLQTKEKLNEMANIAQDAFEAKQSSGQLEVEFSEFIRRQALEVKGLRDGLETVVGRLNLSEELGVVRGSVEHFKEKEARMEREIEELRGREREREARGGEVEREVARQVHLQQQQQQLASMQQYEPYNNLTGGEGYDASFEKMRYDSDSDSDINENSFLNNYESNYENNYENTYDYEHSLRPLTSSSPLPGATANSSDSVEDSETKQFLEGSVDSLDYELGALSARMKEEEEDEEVQRRERAESDAIQLEAEQLGVAASPIQKRFRGMRQQQLHLQQQQLLHQQQQQQQQQQLQVAQTTISSSPPVPFWMKLVTDDTTSSDSPLEPNSLYLLPQAVVNLESALNLASQSSRESSRESSRSASGSQGVGAKIAWEINVKSGQKSTAATTAMGKNSNESSGNFELFDEGGSGFFVPGETEPTIMLLASTFAEVRSANLKQRPSHVVEDGDTHGSSPPLVARRIIHSSSSHKSAASSRPSSSGAESVSSADSLDIEVLNKRNLTRFAKFGGGGADDGDSKSGKSSAKEKRRRKEKGEKKRKKANPEHELMSEKIYGEGGGGGGGDELDVFMSIKKQMRHTERLEHEHEHESEKEKEKEKENGNYRNSRPSSRSLLEGGYAAVYQKRMSKK
ncbi:hypothetical protein ScalyP_jg247 [Parmales sp. scaly parma]|nr:hypothetical protein ScalyP_jg247 [Parmales sp. scaly parma]